MSELFPKSVQGLDHPGAACAFAAAAFPELRGHFLSMKVASPAILGCPTSNREFAFKYLLLPVIERNLELVSFVQWWHTATAPVEVSWTDLLPSGDWKYSVLTQRSVSQ